jgi:ribosomal-protein-serine acetyltransferase
MFRADTKIEGLYLTLAELRHAPKLFQLVEQNRDYLRNWLPWLDYNTTVEDSENFLRNCQASYAAQSQLNVLLFYGEELVGTTGFNSISHVNHHADIGYWLSEHYNGRGFMTAAVEKLIQIGFEEYGLNRQVIRAMSHNSASRNVAERLGFTHEGCQRQAANQYGTYYDLEVYSLLKSEWSAT